MEKLLEIICGTLLGDGCIKSDNYKYKKYFCYKLTSKDKKFLEWFNLLLRRFSINCWFTVDNKISNVFSLYFYINSSKYSKEFLKLREKWYKEKDGKHVQKIIPKDLKLTPTVLLHWYLGDGSLIRRKNDSNRVPYIVLATNTFSKGDISFIIQKLKELNLNFYPVKYKSGFTGKESGYCLYSRTEDGTSFRFFKLIGECPKEIANCSNGRKGIYHEEKFFKDKWPTEEDWIKILSNVKGIGEMLKERRIQMSMSRKELTKMLNANKDYIRKIEAGRRFPSVDKLRKILKNLNLSSFDVSNFFIQV